MTRYWIDSFFVFNALLNYSTRSLLTSAKSRKNKHSLLGCIAGNLFSSNSRSQCQTITEKFGLKQTAAAHWWTLQSAYSLSVCVVKAKAIKVYVFLSAFSSHVGLTRTFNFDLFYSNDMEEFARLRGCAIAIKHRVIINVVDPRDTINASQLLLREFFSNSTTINNKIR